MTMVRSSPSAVPSAPGSAVVSSPPESESPQAASRRAETPRTAATREVVLKGGVVRMKVPLSVLRRSAVVEQPGGEVGEHPPQLGQDRGDADADAHRGRPQAF